MKINKKRIQTVKDCKNIKEIKDAILEVIYQHEIMANRTKSKELAYESLVQSVDWFLNPEKKQRS
jgi:hypothetical protein